MKYSYFYMKFIFMFCVLFLLGNGCSNPASTSSTVSSVLDDAPLTETAKIVDSSESDSESAVEVSPLPKTASQAPAVSYSYSFEDVSESYDDSTIHTNFVVIDHQRLIKVGSDESYEIMFEDIRTIDPMFNQTDVIFSLVSSAAYQNFLVLYAYNGAVTTTSPQGKSFYRLNLGDKSVTRLDISNVLNSSWDRYYLSPDGNYLVVIPVPDQNDGTISRRFGDGYIADISRNTFIPWFSLSSDEQLRLYDPMNTDETIFSWIDNNTFKYAVYPYTENDPSNELPMKEFRTALISSESL